MALNPAGEFLQSVQPAGREVHHWGNEKHIFWSRCQCVSSVNKISGGHFAKALSGDKIQRVHEIFTEQPLSMRRPGVKVMRDRQSVRHNYYL